MSRFYAIRIEIESHKKREYAVLCKNLFEKKPQKNSKILLSVVFSKKYLRLIYCVFFKSLDLCNYTISTIF